MPEQDDLFRYWIAATGYSKLPGSLELGFILPPHVMLFIQKDLNYQEYALWGSLYAAEGVRSLYE